MATKSARNDHFYQLQEREPDFRSRLTSTFGEERLNVLRLDTAHPGPDSGRTGTCVNSCFRNREQFSCACVIRLLHVLTVTARTARSSSLRPTLARRPGECLRDLEELFSGAWGETEIRVEVMDPLCRDPAKVDGCAGNDV